MLVSEQRVIKPEPLSIHFVQLSLVSSSKERKVDVLCSSDSQCIDDCKHEPHKITPDNEWNLVVVSADQRFEREAFLTLRCDATLRCYAAMLRCGHLVATWRENLHRPASVYCKLLFLFVLSDVCRVKGKEVAIQSFSTVPQSISTPLLARPKSPGRLARRLHTGVTLQGSLMENLALFHSFSASRHARPPPPHYRYLCFDYRSGLYSPLTHPSPPRIRGRAPGHITSLTLIVTSSGG
ncbi:uncharacterized protein V6R79_001749 [Siganus canaliculatus]